MAVHVWTIKSQWRRKERPLDAVVLRHMFQVWLSSWDDAFKCNEYQCKAALLDYVAEACYCCCDAGARERGAVLREADVGIDGRLQRLAAGHLGGPRLLLRRAPGNWMKQPPCHPKPSCETAHRSRPVWQIQCWQISNAAHTLPRCKYPNNSKMVCTSAARSWSCSAELSVCWSEKTSPSRNSTPMLLAADALPGPPAGAGAAERPGGVARRRGVPRPLRLPGVPHRPQHAVSAQMLPFQHVCLLLLLLPYTCAKRAPPAAFLGHDAHDVAASRELRRFQVESPLSTKNPPCCTVRAPPATLSGRNAHGITSRPRGMAFPS